MLLAIDTATRWAALALHNGSDVVAETGWKCFNTHTIELSPAIDEMLKRANITTHDLDGIAVTIGPGSYTGLRVGLALAKGLALANQVPLIGVPTLDVLATSFGPHDGRLLVTASAGRSRVVAAAYQWQKGQWQSEGDPQFLSWDELLASLDGESTLFAGEISTDAAKRIRAAGKAYKVATPAASVRRAGFLAELGWRRLRKDQVDDARVLAPLYMRDPTGN